MSKKTDFIGPLATPFKQLKIGLLTSADQFEAAYRERTREELAKLDLLADHYGVARGAYLQLCLVLARQIVPGFREAGLKGKPKAWVISANAVLVAEVERLTAAGQTQIAAIRKLALQKRWKEFLKGREWESSDYADPADTLRQQYKIARKLPDGRIGRDAFRFHKLTGDLAGWESFVDECLNPEEK